jgi:DNA invertase Pin-like site-specific DNA recombinase
VVKRSRQFRRVSTNLQDSKKQIADLARWDTDHGYDAGTPYVCDDMSAYHGKHVPELERAIEDMEAGRYDVLTFWASDRMWRGKSLATILGYIERLEVNGYVEFVNEPHLNNRDLDPMVRNILFANAFGMSYAESKRKSERTRMDIADKKSRGNAHGRPAWGMVVKCRVCGTVTERAEDNSIIKCSHKDTKDFVYTDEGRKYLPVIFDLIIQGKSARTVAQWLDSEGVSTSNGGKWHEGYITNRIIKNKTYMGHRPNAGNLEVEAIISPTTWKQANAALAARYRPGRDATKREKALLKPFCAACYGEVREGCSTGRSPMYRVYVGSGENRRAYYRCTGAGPQRKGCGAPMIPCEDLDSFVTAMASSNPNPHTDRVFIPGDDQADQIEALKLSLDSATNRAESNSIWDAIEALETQPSVSAHWEDKETGQTEGDYFTGLDSKAQREYLARLQFTAGYPTALNQGLTFNILESN